MSRKKAVLEKYLLELSTKNQELRRENEELRRRIAELEAARPAEPPLETEASKVP